jgi:hypothetical protein
MGGVSIRAKSASLCVSSFMVCELFDDIARGRGGQPLDVVHGIDADILLECCLESTTRGLV